MKSISMASNFKNMVIGVCKDHLDYYESMLLLKTDEKTARQRYYDKVANSMYSFINSLDDLTGRKMLINYQLGYIGKMKIDLENGPTAGMVYAVTLFSAEYKIADDEDIKDIDQQQEELIRIVNSRVFHSK